MKDRFFRSSLQRGALLLLTASVVAGAAPTVRADDFEESRSAWAVAPPFGEKLQPGVQRDGTLRVIRFANDRQILNDPGTVVGFTAIFARTGELSPTHPYMTDQKSILEIMRRGGVKRADVEPE
ncbi:hypothetical protein K2Z84_29405 [Candidatus Binatia bacterium]|nr:hypothetical protein [Candidatus Binatia bacterium]